MQSTNLFPLEDEREIQERQVIFQVVVTISIVQQINLRERET